MKRLFLYTVAFFIGGIFLIELVRRDSGYVLISLGDTTIESSFWFAAIVFIAALLLFKFGLRIAGKTLRSIGESFSLISESRQKQAQRRTNSGLIHYIEGNWRAAKKDLLSAAKYSEQPLVHYLAAAHSAQQMGDKDESQQLLLQAEQVAPENSLAIALSQAKIYIADEKFEQALATLERIRDQHSQHPVVLDLLRQVYTQLHDWQALSSLLPQLRQTKLYSSKRLAALEIEAHCTHLNEENKMGNTDTRLQRITAVWQKIPKALRKEPALVATYTTILIAGNSDQDQHEKAEILLRQTLNKNWQPSLVQLYGRTKPSQASEQMLVAEQWLRAHPGDAILLQALARIAMRNQLWGKARGYFENSLQLQEKPETYAELAALLAQLGDHQKSTDLYQKGLLLSTHSAS